MKLKALDIASAQRLAASEIRAGMLRTCPHDGLTGAQRLAASEIRAVVVDSSPHDGLTGAQRLAASEIRAEAQGYLQPGSLDVLNALRHQRSEQPSTYQSYLGRFGSAQRLAASEIRAESWLTFWPATAGCSTPCGIRDPSRAG